MCCPLDYISIHALREEGDLPANSTERTVVISIHALREEGDGGFPAGSSSHRNFYPRPPRGGRPETPEWTLPPWTFLSTPSARRATTSTGSTSHTLAYFYPRPPRGGRPSGAVLHFDSQKISIHALREEGDLVARPVTS